MRPAKTITTPAADRIEWLAGRLKRTGELETWSTEEQGKQALEALAEIVELATEARREMAVWTVQNSEHSANKVAKFGGITNKTVNAWVEKDSQRV